METLGSIGSALDHIVADVLAGRPRQELWLNLWNVHFRSNDEIEAWRTMRCWFEDRGVAVTRRPGLDSQKVVVDFVVFRRKA